MGRIRKAYETQFTWLLQKAGARRLEEGVCRMVAQAEQRAGREQRPLADALTMTYERLSSHPFFVRKHEPATANGFFCDAGLGGLARWLRAAGHPAEWVPDIDDDALLAATRQRGAILLTTDSMLMERRLLRTRVIPSFWLPPTLSIRRQLELVFREFKLTQQAPLCMTCGGNLSHAHKESLRDRIPPRTYKWLDKFFICGNCGKLFWHGTHWQRITESLRAVGDMSGGTIATGQ